MKRRKLRNGLVILLVGLLGCLNSKDTESSKSLPKATHQPVTASAKKLTTSDPIESTVPAVAPGDVPQPKVEPVTPEKKLDLPQANIKLDEVQATPVELTPHKVQFEYDQVRYSVFAPQDTKFKSTQSPIYVSGGPHFNMKIALGSIDLEEVANDLGSAEGSKILLRTPESLIIQKQSWKSDKDSTPVNSVVFFMNRTFGYRDFSFSCEEGDFVTPPVRYHAFTFTLGDCKAMMQAAERMSLAEPLPDDPAAILERLSSTVRQSDGKVQAIFLDVIRTTDATLPLVKKFPSITQLSAKSVHMRESTLASVLAELPHLEQLDLSDAEITGNDIPDLKGQPHLKDLLQGGGFDSHITDTSLARLSDLKELESLTLGAGDLSGARLAQIPILPNLVTLHLVHVQGDNDPTQASGLAHFSKFSKLQELNLSYLGGMTDDGLKGVAAINALQKLHIHNCSNITNAGVASLTSLKELTFMDLSETKVDDGVVTSLSQLKSLRGLWIRRTKITDDGFQKLKVALPQCEIEYK